jgi:hypothetical protein
MKWKTWIGEGFNQTAPEKRLLVIGESNYDGDDRVNFVWENVENATEGNEYRKSGFFKYVSQCLTGDKDPDMSTLNQVAYNVIVQKPMEDSSTRPGPSDYRSGWIEVFEEIKRLEVKQCLFIGVGAANHFNYACKRIFRKGEYGLKRSQMIKGCYSRVGFIKNDEFDVELTFIRHAGRGGWKYWMEWSHYLNELGIRF